MQSIYTWNIVIKMEGCNRKLGPCLLLQDYLLSTHPTSSFLTWIQVRFLNINCTATVRMYVRTSARRIGDGYHWSASDSTGQGQDLSDTVLSGMRQNDIISHDMTWQNMTWRDMTCYDMIWHDITSHDMTSHDMTSHDMTWHDMTSYDMTWHDMS